MKQARWLLLAAVGILMVLPGCKQMGQPRVVAAGAHVGDFLYGGYEETRTWYSVYPGESFTIENIYVDARHGEPTPPFSSPGWNEGSLQHWVYSASPTGPYTDYFPGYVSLTLTVPNNTPPGDLEFNPKLQVGTDAGGGTIGEGTGAKIGVHVLGTVGVTFDVNATIKDGADFAGTVLTVDGTDYMVADLPVTFQWDIASQHTYAYTSPCLVTANEKQYVWTSTTAPAGWPTGQSGTITVDGAGTVVGNYNIQYWLTFVSDPDLELLREALPADGWYDAGYIPPTLDDVVNPDAYGATMHFTGWTPTPPLSGAGQYTAHWELSAFGFYGWVEPNGTNITSYKIYWRYYDFYGNDLATEPDPYVSQILPDVGQLNGQVHYDTEKAPPAWRQNWNQVDPGTYSITITCAETGQTNTFQWTRP